MKNVKEIIYVSIKYVIATNHDFNSHVNMTKSQNYSGLNIKAK